MKLINFQFVGNIFSLLERLPPMEGSRISCRINPFFLLRKQLQLKRQATDTRCTLFKVASHSRQLFLGNNLCDIIQMHNIAFLQWQFNPNNNATPALINVLILGQLIYYSYKTIPHGISHRFALILHYSPMLSTIIL